MDTNIDSLSIQIKTNANSAVKGINALSASLSKLENATKGISGLKEVTNQVKSLGNALDTLGTENAAKISEISKTLSKLPANMQKVSDSASNSFLHSKFSVAKFYSEMTIAGRALSKVITLSNDYIENMNLFNVSMGEYAKEARAYAEQAAEVMGIDPGEWMKSQGVFNTIITGFGVASDKAYLMSKNLTQLGYDLASYYNLLGGPEEAMTKLRSGISGELEPLRQLGYDLSVARLQQEAYNLGITKSVSAMTQAEKSQLRYYTIMTQVTKAQGDMARTLESPANQLRVFKAQLIQAGRALGNLFIPLLNEILPVCIAVTKVITMLTKAFANLFGLEMKEVFPDMQEGSNAMGDLTDSTVDENKELAELNKKLKKTKNALLGIDELNVISPPEADSASGSGNSGAGGDINVPLPEYEFLENAVNQKVNDIVEKMKEWLGITEEINTWSELFDTRLGDILKIVGMIGTGFASWKIAKGVISFMDKIQNLEIKDFSIKGLGALEFMSDLNEFVTYFEDFLENGATFKNVSGMISEFTGSIGSALKMLGKTEWGAALDVVQGIGEIVGGIGDMVENSPNWDNTTMVLRGLLNFAEGIALLTGKFKTAAWLSAFQGLTSVVREIGKNFDAIKEGDWSNVDWVTVATGSLQVLGGFVFAVAKFSKYKETLNKAQPTATAEKISEVTGQLDTSINTGVSPKLKSLAKNLGLGIGIIAEVAVALGLTVGAVALVGKELELVGNAWQPVIDNYETVLIAVGIGTGALATVGTATGALGKFGKKTLVKDIALGTAILAEIGAATALFIVEVWGIGKGLDEVGQAWQPVIDNYETVLEGIGWGSAALVAVAGITGGLGALTTATGGTIAAAIAIGTAFLAEVALAFVTFNESLVLVADELNYRLAPSLNNLNDTLPVLSNDMSDFVDFMGVFADEVVEYTKSSSISGLSATVDAVVQFFTRDPIDKLADDIDKVGKQTFRLNQKLYIAVPQLSYAVDLLQDYKYFLVRLEELTDCNFELSSGMFVNMKDVGQKLVTGFVNGIESKSSSFINEAKKIVDGFTNKIKISSYSSKSVITDWANNIEDWFTDKVSKSSFRKLAKDVIDGFNTGVNVYYYTSGRFMNKWADSIIGTFKDSLDSHSPSRVFAGIATDTVVGYNNNIRTVGKTTKGVINDWANSFTEVKPVMSFAIDTSALKYYNASSFSKSISAEVSAYGNYDVSGFKEDMKEFFREYLQPYLSEMAEDIKRQADKEEKTVVTVGARSITQAVDKQRKANGYNFSGGGD